MNDLPETVSYGTRDLRTHLRDAMDNVIAGHHIEITRHSKAEAFIVPASWYRTATAALAAMHAPDGV